METRGRRKINDKIKPSYTMACLFFLCILLSFVRAQRDRITLRFAFFNGFVGKVFEGSHSL